MTIWVIKTVYDKNCFSEVKTKDAEKNEVYIFFFKEKNSDKT